MIDKRPIGATIWEPEWTSAQGAEQTPEQGAEQTSEREPPKQALNVIFQKSELREV